jgi:nicotinic acid mononucleotide adenylyltransferase
MDHPILYGSSFNPPHIGHLACLILLNKMCPDRPIWVSVSPSRPDKRPFFSTELRYAWAKELVSCLHLKGLKAQLLPWSSIPHESHGTWWLLEHLRSQCKIESEREVFKVTIALGADSYLTLPQWGGHFLDLKDTTTSIYADFLVIPRHVNLNPEPFLNAVTHFAPPLDFLASSLEEWAIDGVLCKEASSTALRSLLFKGRCEEIYRMTLPSIARSLFLEFLD